MCYRFEVLPFQLLKNANQNWPKNRKEIKIIIMADTQNLGTLTDINLKKK